jgi:hypothetical protein
MKRNSSVLVGISLCAALYAVGTTLLAAWQGGAQDQAVKALEERALRNGGQLAQQFAADRSVVCSNLQELARRSPIVVIGTTLRHRSRLTPDAKCVNSDFAVSVQEVLKGQLRPGSVITVSLPGGGHRFPDGASVFFYPSNYRLTINDRVYAFFLRAGGKDTLGRGPLYELALGVQGQFELDRGTGMVIPSVRMPNDPIATRYKDMAITRYLLELHQAVGKRK